MAGERTAARPVRASDRAFTPAVLITAIVCITALTLAVLAAGLYCLTHDIDPTPLLKYLGPAAIAGAAVLLLNGGGLLAALPKLGRIERNTGASAPAVAAEPESRG